MMPNTGWPEIDTLDERTVVDVRPANGWYVAAKVAVDAALALALLIPGLPVILACWVVVKLGSPGPGFYTQTRLGRNGKPYKIVKIRTMAVDAERTGAQWAKRGDMRVTRVGRFLRATHLDELPQLFNVLLGQMSLVGPRPERPEIVKAMGLSERIPGYTHRLRVRPGVTGLAQLQLPADTDIGGVRRKVVYDLYYIEHTNLWLDLRILAATALKAAGLRPGWLRRLFFLPCRAEVATVFIRNLLPPTEPSSYTEFLPA